MEETLPGVGDDGPGERVVCHVDMDCFYASCERLKEPELAGEPVVVGMGYESGESHGAVATASYEAREYGVDSAQPISDALDRLPRAADADASDPDAPDPAEAGHYRPVDMEFYESVASDVKAVLHDLADTVREVSIDEAYLDVTDRTRWDRVGEDADDTTADTAAGGGGPGDGTGGEGDDSGGRTLAEGFARHVREEIQRRVGVPASVGVAPNMAVAKVASDYDKPDGLTVVPPDRVREFLAPLPVEDIHGVGPVRAREFAEMGIETAGDLAAADPTTLVERFGDRGRELYDRARGRDDREVTPRGRPKSLSRESAFTEATSDETAKREKVRALAADVAERARSRDATYQTIGIKAVRPPFDVNTRAESLSGPVDDPELVREVALELLTEFADEEVRKLGVRVSKLSFSGGDQTTLGGYDAADADRSGENETAGCAATAAAGDGSGPAAEPVASATLDEWETESRDRTPPETLAEWAADAGTTGGRRDGETDGDGGVDGNGRRRRQPSLRSFDTTDREGGGATETGETVDEESDDE
ncbi:DNA polymerase IV [Halobaculum sp. MBLA0147]|uniref:DNA polymerase Y family protein n=1 Tax=Halobaculum sp. MBLA0147 TaxID=3079934 RepID=UPI003525685B